MCIHMDVCISVYTYTQCKLTKHVTRIHQENHIQTKSPIWKKLLKDPSILACCVYEQMITGYQFYILFFSQWHLQEVLRSGVK